jgi:hypothetical protein
MSKINSNDKFIALTMRRFFLRQLFWGLGFLLFSINGFAQQKAVFEKLPFDSFGIRSYQILPTTGGGVRLISSLGFWIIKGRDASGVSVTSEDNTAKNYRVKAQSEDSIRAMAEGPDSVLFFATHDNLVFWTTNSEVLSVLYPTFSFPPKGETVDKISSMYIDRNSDLFIGTQTNNFYYIKQGADKKRFTKGITEYAIEDSMLVIKKGELPVKKIVLGLHVGAFSFVQDKMDKSIIWVGTNHGLYLFNKATNQSKSLIPSNGKTALPVTVTHIEADKDNNIWFSTLEKGLGFYDQKADTVGFFQYPKTNKAAKKFPLSTFYYKSEDEFFVAVTDSLPAIFNTKLKIFYFLNDPLFKKSKNRTTDIKVDRSGTLWIIKGEAVFFGKASKIKIPTIFLKQDSSLITVAKADSNLSVSLVKTGEDLPGPFIRSVYDINGNLITNDPHRLEVLKLKHNQNSLLIVYDMNDVTDRKGTEFAWKMDGLTHGWEMLTILNPDTANVAYVANLKPGKYLFELKMKKPGEDWRKQQAKMIIISPPFWQTWWFWAAMIAGLSLLIFLIVKLRVRAVRRAEKQKAKYEKDLLELEAKALRAQMNPHFVFNCLNSIKSLMQENKTDIGVTYLTTFSKLIRTLFNNADKKEISLYDEIETCKLYLQLEAMRFDTKFSYSVNVDDNIDLKSIQIPALIIQPFIENAIWHGIVPRKSGGHVSLNVLRKDGAIEVVIDDDGIGREASAQNKSASSLVHQSKGVNLTQSRLELNNLLQQRQARLEVIDKKDENRMATGTKVIITLIEES